VLWARELEVVDISGIADVGGNEVDKRRENGVKIGRNEFSGAGTG